MNVVFEIKDKTGRKIHLSKERWSHIRQRHPNVADIEEIEETLKNPLKIIEAEEDFVAYYKHFKHRKESAKYLKIIVKYLNGDGYVISSYFVKDML
ncbi:MAG: PBECR2 nuclease fold domain-containing protein [Nanoarchaeota archaeon]|nr:PBECR2 nuclease fold domain-containing protein [Nanoarchaeota archaeon]